MALSDVLAIIERFAEDARSVARLNEGYRMLICKLGPRLVTVDSEFTIAPNAVTRFMIEDADNELNAIPIAEGFARALTGVPSHRTMELTSEVPDHDCEWLDGNRVRQDRPGPLPDGYREKSRRRGTCLMPPR